MSLRSANRGALAVAAGSVVAAVLLGVLILGVRLSDDVVGLYQTLGVVLLVALVVAIVFGRLSRRVPRGTVLELDLAKVPPESRGGSPLEALRGVDKALTLHETVETLERAGRDPRVVGLVLHIGFGPAGLAQIQELRDAVASFRAAGKWTIAHAHDFGGNGSYYLASAADEVVLQPLGGVGLVGLGRELNFLKGALDKAGIAWEGDKRREYKSAYDQLQQTALTAATREQLVELFESQFEQIVAGIAEGRGLSTDDVRALADRAPLLDTEALDGGLVDRLAFRDDVTDAAKKRAGNDKALLWLERYRRRTGAGRARGATTVALITGTGTITDQAAVPLGGRGMVGHKVADLVRKAVDDKRVKAILFRVDSPGGSAVASETIREATARARAAGKPVVLTMGNVAASGGYWVATSVDRVVARPGTVTGSIGVLSGKPVLAELKAKLGMTVDEVHTSVNALHGSVNRSWTPTEWERLQAGLDQIYDAFLARVAEARGKTVEEVDELARGRVWTGAQAHERGLVDTLGGFPEALAAVRELVGVGADAPIRLKDMEKRSPLQQLRSKKGRSSDDLAAAAGLVLEAVRPVVGALVDRGPVHMAWDPHTFDVR